MNYSIKVNKLEKENWSTKAFDFQWYLKKALS